MLKRIRAVWKTLRPRRAATAMVGGYRFGDAPTSEEMAAFGAVVAQQEIMSHSPGSRERLLRLIEECAEVQHAAAKVLLHGYGTRSRGGRGMPRRVVLERELGQLLAALEALYIARELRPSQVRDWQRRQPREEDAQADAQMMPAAEVPQG